MLQAIAAQWVPHLGDAQAEPSALARAAIGRALGQWDLDRRHGIGLRADGLPEIDWVRIKTPGPFFCQDGQHPALPTFDIARYPVTHRHFQAFVDAGGYADDRWWKGLAKRIEAPLDAAWAEPNAPRETVSWYEAVAFCRWLGAQWGQDIRLPTEAQWERAARGVRGRKYPWGKVYLAGCANCNEVASEVTDGVFIGRTSAVGIYPHPSAEGVHDLAGNVWEWCLNEQERPLNMDDSGNASRVLRGGSWVNDTGNLRAAFRYGHAPDVRVSDFGFRVCRVSPIEKLGTGALDAGSLAR